MITTQFSILGIFHFIWLYLKDKNIKLYMHTEQED